MDQRLKVAFVVGAAVAISTTSHATAVIPDAAYSGTGYTLAGPGTNTYVEGAGSFATVTFTPTPSPSITLHVVGGDPAISYQGFSSDGLTYYYHISGPSTASGFVASQITTSMNVSASGFVTSANAVLTGYNIPAIMVCAGNSYCDPASLGSSFSGTVDELLPFDGYIQMGVGVNVYNGVGDAFIDPVITVPLGYTIAFSAGIGNSPADPTGVPEPASLALMLAGTIGLTVARRRTR